MANYRKSSSKGIKGFDKYFDYYMKPHTTKKRIRKKYRGNRSKRIKSRLV